MQTTTLNHYQRASALRAQASYLLDRLELLARHDVDRAEKLIYPAWERLSRRSAKVSEAAGQHWGGLLRSLLAPLLIEPRLLHFEQAGFYFAVKLSLGEA